MLARIGNGEKGSNNGFICALYPIFIQGLRKFQISIRVARVRAEIWKRVNTATCGVEDVGDVNSVRGGQYDTPWLSGQICRKGTEYKRPIPVAARPKVWGRSLAGIVGSNPARAMDVCLLWVLCDVRDLCVGLISRPEESYRLWCV